MKFNIKCYSATKLVFNELAEQIILPGDDGEFAISVNHMKFFSIISSGLLRIKREKSDSLGLFLISDGFVTVENNNIQIFVNFAEPITYVNLAQVEANLKNLKEQFKNCEAIFEKEKISNEIFKLIIKIKAARFLKQ